MTAKLKHLDYIQAVIARLAGASFQVKGWSLTLVSALFALSASQKAPAIAMVAVVPAVLFWALDGYFLRQERLFRALYDAVRRLDESEIDFSMDTSAAAPAGRWIDAVLSRTLFAFHGLVIAAVVAVSGIMLSPAPL
jgi:hypothetical protein